MTEADALANELTLGWPIFATEDAKEGATAFKEKRKADFLGRLGHLSGELELDGSVRTVRQPPPHACAPLGGAAPPAARSSRVAWMSLPIRRLAIQH